MSIHFTDFLPLYPFPDDTLYTWNASSVSKAFEIIISQIPNSAHTETQRNTHFIAGIGDVDIDICVELIATLRIYGNYTLSNMILDTIVSYYMSDYDELVKFIFKLHVPDIILMCQGTDRPMAQHCANDKFWIDLTAHIYSSKYWEYSGFTKKERFIMSKHHASCMNQDEYKFYNDNSLQGLMYEIISNPAFGLTDWIGTLAVAMYNMRFTTIFIGACIITVRRNNPIAMKILLNKWGTDYIVKNHWVSNIFYYATDYHSVYMLMILLELEPKLANEINSLMIKTALFNMNDDVAEFLLLNNKQRIDNTEYNQLIYYSANTVANLGVERSIHKFILEHKIEIINASFGG